LNIVNSRIPDLEEYTYNMPLKTSYSHGNANPEPFSQELGLHTLRIIKKGITLFEDQIIIDIGAGKTQNGYLASKALKARAYIGVEPFFAPSLYINLLTRNQKGSSTLSQLAAKNTQQIPTCIIPEDMLSFLKKIPNNSVSILCSGIDRAILDNNYLTQANAELIRTLHPKGGILNYISDFHFPNLQNIFPRGILGQSPLKIYKK